MSTITRKKHLSFALLLGIFCTTGLQAYRAAVIPITRNFSGDLRFLVRYKEEDSSKKKKKKVYSLVGKHEGSGDTPVTPMVAEDLRESFTGEAAKAGQTAPLYPPFAQTLRMGFSKLKGLAPKK